MFSPKASPNKDTITTWLKYLNEDTKIEQPLTDSNDTIYLFFSKYEHKTLDPKELRSKFVSNLSKEEFANLAYEVYDIKSKNVENLSIFCQYLRNSRNAGNKLVYERESIIIAFHSLFSAIFEVKKLIKELINEHEESNVWGVIHEPLRFLLSLDNNDVLTDLTAVIPEYLESFTILDRLPSISSDSIILKSFDKLITIIAPQSIRFYDLGDISTITFINNTLINLLTRSDFSFGECVLSYFRVIIKIIPLFSSDLKKSLMLIASTLISMPREMEIKGLDLLCLQIISLCNDFQQQACKFATKSFMIYIKNLIENNKDAFDEIKKIKAPETFNIEELKQFKPLSEDLIPEKITKQVDICRNFTKSMGEYPDFLEEVLENISVDSDVLSFISCVMAVSLCSQKKFREFIEVLIKDNANVFVLDTYLYRCSLFDSEVCKIVIEEVVHAENLCEHALLLRDLLEKRPDEFFRSPLSTVLSKVESDKEVDNFIMYAFETDSKKFLSSNFIKLAVNEILKENDDLMRILSFTPKVINESFKQVIDTFSLMFHEEIEPNYHYIKIANTYLTSLTNAIILIPREHIDYIISKLLPSASKAAEILRSDTVLESTLSLILNMEQKFSDIANIVFSENSLTYNNIKLGITKIKPTKESIYDFVSISLCIALESWDKVNEKEAPPILAPFSLKMGLLFSKETEFENPLFLLCSSLCSKSASNAYELFKANFVKCSLDRVHDPNVIDAALLLARSISFHFFSAVSLSDSLKAIKLPSKDLVAQQMLIDSLTQMTIEDKHPPVDSFFHISGGSIRGISIDFSKYPEFAFVTSLRMGHESNKILRMGQLILSSKFDGFSLTKGDTSIDIPFKYKSFFWVQVIFVFTPKAITLYSEGKKVFKKSFKMGFESSPVEVKLTEGYRGDIGPTFLISSGKLDVIEKTIAAGNSKLLMASFIPLNTVGNRIEDVIDNQTAILDGAAVPYVTTISDVLKFPGSFRGLISLFNVIDEKTCVQPSSSSQFLHSLLTLLNKLISSKENNETFQKIGGFKLLGGFLSLSHPLAMNPDVFNDLKEMYISTEAKKQMIRFVWLNFALYEKMPISLQIHYFTRVLPSIVDDNFIFDNNAFIISQMANYSLENHLSKEIEWNFYDSLCQHVPDQDVYAISLLFLHDPDSYTGQRCWSLLNRCLGSKENIASTREIIEKIKPESFAKLLGSKSLDLRMKVIKILYLLSTSDCCADEKHISRYLVDKITDGEMMYIFKLAFGFETTGENFMRETTELVSCDFLMLFFEAFERSSKSNFEALQGKIIRSISNFPDSFNPIFEYQNWSYTVLRFGFNGENPIKILTSLAIYGMREEMPKPLTDAWCLLSGLKMWSLRDVFISTVIHTSIECRHSFEQIHRAIEFGLKSLFFQAIEPENKELLEPKSLDIYSMFWNESPSEELRDSLLSALKFTISQKTYAHTFNITSSLSISTIKAFLYLAWIYGKNDINFYESARIYTSGIMSQVPKAVMQESIVFLVDARRKLIESKKRANDIYGIQIEPELCTKCVQLFTNSLNSEFKQAELEFNGMFYEFKDRLVGFIDEKEADIDVAHLFEQFDKFERDSRKLFERHSIKLAEVFLEEDEINTDLKWKVSQRLDNDLQPIFMSVNDNYDDHKKASALRDSLSYKETAAEEEKLPFKALLQSKKSSQGSQQSLVSFHSHYITLAYRFKGSLHLTEDGLFFEGEADADGIFTPYDETKPKVTKFVEFEYEDINFIFKRTSLYEDIACEVFKKDNKSFLFIFEVKEERDQFLERIRAASKYHNENIIKNITHVFEAEFDFFKNLRRVCKGVTQNLPPQELFDKIGATKAWMNHKISTFKYLMIINIISGRSFNDICQYPIFPWIICDYTSETIDLKDPSVYRDLSKPIGALNEERLENLQMLLSELRGVNKTEDCLYRTHMSNPGYTIGYLIRLEPFSTLHISLQSGRFDIPDRLFYDIPRTWRSITGMANDFRELIPQFFCFPAFLKNENHYDLGKNQSGDVLDDVVLPPWAKTAEEFVSINRRALESDIVGQNIGNWIDLVFGINRMSEEHNNLFHPFSYDTIVKDYIDKPEFHNIVQNHCANFGTFPAQIFTSPHPSRSPEVIDTFTSKFEGRVVTGEPRFITEGIYVGSDGLLQKLKSETANYQLAKAFSQSSSFAYSRDNKLLFCCGTGRCCSVWNTRSKILQATLTHNGGSIECVSCDGDYAITGGSDCSVHIYSLPTLEHVSTFSQRNLPIIHVSMSTKLGVFASIDVAHTLILGFITTGRIIASTIIECKPESAHTFTFLDEGYVIVSSCAKEIDEECSYTTLSVYNMRAERVSREVIQGEIVDMADISTTANTVFAVLFRDGRVTFFTPSLQIIKETYENSYGTVIGRLDRQSEKIITATDENKVHIISAFD